MDESRGPGRLKFHVAMLLALALLPVGYWLFLDREPAPRPVFPAIPADAGASAQAAPAAPLPARSREELRIAEVEGKVEMRQGGGGFVPASVGAVLRAEDAIRTGEGRARIASGEAYEVGIEPGTVIEVKELTEQISKLDLGAGMLVATVSQGSGQQLVVTAAGSDAIASCREGTFALSNNGQGTVAAAARAGEVELRAAGKAVTLRAGQQSLVEQGPPRDPEPIPASLFLKVDWPQGGETNKRRLVVAGRTTPGAVVRVAGRSAFVAADGSFKEELRLKEGLNRLQLEGVDVGGNRSTRRTEIRVDTTAPDSDISTQKLWEQ